jgi:hypothetical protein
VCACGCVRARACARVCVCVCVCAAERVLQAQHHSGLQPLHSRPPATGARRVGRPVPRAPRRLDAFVCLEAAVGRAPQRVAVVCGALAADGLAYVWGRGASKWRAAGWRFEAGRREAARDPRGQGRGRAGERAAEASSRRASLRPAQAAGAARPAAGGPAHLEVRLQAEVAARLQRLCGALDVGRDLWGEGEGRGGGGGNVWCREAHGAFKAARIQSHVGRQAASPAPTPKDN